ncbi:hypothetical protein A3A39_01740 [Candidatus Kaiserbacteria bacterium RIFCSPLOWO2_01_FULL_54_13]|uniref:Uncharacterized protein n=1 Tax=Candidatus Kaiserbacteria bacterium RIFCSPLOWO2_01_FULL_54_13 TaxID=1798512 RepID=A0A1F6F1E0_9BACT|nr:MAG: hypothetical protein A3A39_01740 [Candidatus Kaiserbacteria bacterium RIFCSPLOWO2_01_FULL_54_13]
MSKATIDNATILSELRALSREVKNLRRDVAFVLPTESLDEYAHPKRILNSYRRATRKFPPRRSA